jgi:hypothetical protein
VGSRLIGKRLGRRLNERVNDGGAAVGIRWGRRFEGGADGKVRGVCSRGAQSEDGGGKRRPRRGGVVRPHFGRRWVRQGGSGGRVTWPTHGGRGARARGGGPCRPASDAWQAAAQS